MNYDKVIVGLLSRIEVLEEEVRALKKGLGELNTETQVNNQKGEAKPMKVKIRKKEVEALYKYAKLVYEGEISRDEAIEIISREYKLNKNSISDYFYGFKSMIHGEKYVRTMNTMGTRYFFEQILKDYGKSALKRALHATMEHIIYYESIGKTTMKTLREIHNEYRNRIEEEI